jgi:hypothetical protein
MWTGATSERFKLEPMQSVSSPWLGEGEFGKVTFERNPKNPDDQIGVKQHDSMDWHLFMREPGTLIRVQYLCIFDIKGWNQSVGGQQ